MMTRFALAAAATLISGATFAQGLTSTAPTPSAPSGVTRNEGAGSTGMAASPGVPVGSLGGAPNSPTSQSGVPQGTINQNESSSAGSSSGQGGGAAR
ncbi:hypothetical protein ACE7GA_08480 [Roseomonas sp. CCTCC AB2023176]|uniref:hypothetical protein n=1 Tax=Roseomonas sp. CCTCC AB2023176 TaxID=3342640 RepID=UPI0035E19B59